MDSTTIGVLGIVLMLVLMFVRVPLAISFLFAGLIGLIFLTGFKTARTPSLLCLIHMGRRIFCRVCPCLFFLGSLSVKAR